MSLQVGYPGEAGRGQPRGPPAGKTGWAEGQRSEGRGFVGRPCGFLGGLATRSMLPEYRLWLVFPFSLNQPHMQVPLGDGVHRFRGWGVNNKISNLTSLA